MTAASNRPPDDQDKIRRWQREHGGGTRPYRIQCTGCFRIYRPDRQPRVCGCGERVAVYVDA